MSQIMLIVGPARVGKSSLIDALTYGAFHREFYPQDIDFQVKLARVAQHKVYEVQPIEWDGKPFGLAQYYANVADLVLIVVNIAGHYDQLEQVVELYQALTSAKQIAIIANLNGCSYRNIKLSNAVSLFAKINNVKIYELNSDDILSVQIEFNYIKEQFSIFSDILMQHNTLVSQFIKCGYKYLKTSLL